MAKKLGSFRILSCTLSVLATVAFIIACGSGDPELLADFWERDNNVSENYMTDKIEDIMEQQLKPPQPPPPPPISSNVGGEESSDSGSGNTSSSSSEAQQPSSASPGVSSSDATSSSSARESLYTLECNILPANSTFPSNTRIPIDKRPEVKCKVKATGAVITLNENVDAFSWTNDPPWYAPDVGTYDNILVKISRATDGTKECDKMEVKCNSKITITGTVTPSSSSKASSNSNTPSSSSKASSNSNTPSSSSSKPASSSSAASNGTKGPCSRYCLWSAGGTCNEINTEHDYIDGGCTKGNCTCEQLIKNCSDYGYLYGSSTCSGTDLNGKNPSTVTILGCCKWPDNQGNPTNNNCWTLKSTDANTNCPNLLTPGKACASSNGACP